jgi:hypothetical protein
MPFRVLMEAATPDGIVFEPLGPRPHRTLKGAISSATRMAETFRTPDAALSVWLISGNHSYIRREIAWVQGEDGAWVPLRIESATSSE